MNSENNVGLENDSAGRVVIVDDNPENLRTLKAILDTKNYDTFPAINGKLALDAIKKVKPDIILLDIMMPDMNGYEVCEKLKADAATKNIPVLFISALDEAMDKVKAFEVGGVDYISKPFEVEEALARVKTHISLFRTQHNLEQANIQLKDHADKLENAYKELEAFSYSVSHDLQAPLRSIAGFSAVIKEDYADDLDETAKEYFSRIENAASHMKMLIEDLLQLSKNSRESFRRQKVNLSDIVNDIFYNLKIDDPDRQIHILVADNVFANSDENLLNVMLTNLLNNAWKFTSKTLNPTIEFGTLLLDKQTVYFVKDNGVGFDEAHSDKIFLPFSRLEEALDFEGTGIGLATVQRVVNVHGGRIWAEGKVNEGATFYFTLA